MAARRPKVAMKIRPPAKKSNAETQWTETWERLSTAIKEIYKRNAGVLSFEELYRNAYNMVLNKQGDKLYNGVRDVVTEHLQQVARDFVVPSFPQMAPGGGMTGGTEFLKTVKNVWEDHTTCMLMIRDILMYMDRVYVKAANLAPVYDLGLDLFRDVVQRSPDYPISRHLIATLLYHIRLERDGEVIDRLVLKNIIDMLLGLSEPRGPTRTRNDKTVYVTDFEETFLESSREFYRLEGQVFLQQCDATEYLKKAERRLQEEEQRIANYLASTTEPKIRQVLEEELLQRHVKAVIEMENSGLVAMLSNDKYNDLSRMYHLFSRVSNGHAEMRHNASSYVEGLARAINETYGGMGEAADPSTIATSASLAKASEQDVEASAASTQQANPTQWVERILALKDKFDKILEQSFANDRHFETDINAAIERSINQNRKAPEFVSLFIDENLRKGLKGKTEIEVDSLLDKTVTLFRFIEEKDVFERYYKQHLAKRLLLGRSVSEDAEKNMIGKLKVECGCQFTVKLEGMFNDMRLAADTMGDFRSHLANSITAPKNMPELYVNVLTSTFWPMNTATSGDTCVFPTEITAAMDHFQRFYHSRHSGRRLTWLTHIGSADIKANFDKGRKEINVSTYAMVLLVGIFNKLADGQSISYDRIREESSIPDHDLKRTLQSLSVAKHRILLKSTKGRDISPSDHFKVNTGFTSQLHKIKIQQISATSGSSSSASNSMETDAERADTLEKVDEARKHQVEACIVRIMKSRKRMDHNNLVAEVVKQLSARFSPSPLMVKKRVEGLIEREYLERDKSDRKIYNYLA
ncbi:uncharacterized protein SPPG_08979 [Spizellomyces punctatus DAOM BR117]|uniref:Cullin family profile domain-containing protein n=1 Tax=Spizellomyces punctatus (strain DAOM BR117) TaxID=645134 RepID=A0A0L0HPH3_SPIPD|nr:uncharacterized protein SPPG_08979 [Spizellomyces punctatus DAOM BR117]KND02992.1 hypothetical protein SPPG_08979 [Spizellomyces punctatus DAOM BR117]|eukprot:XP_016611031.1 hypothetical protein SPPG_08979 [Spizellomyces punctatus DAOM BR117]